jgi:hypothetical protein
MHTCHKRWLATTPRPSSTPMDCGTCHAGFCRRQTHAGACTFVITRLGSYILDLAVDVRQQRCQDPHISDYTRAVTSCAPIFSAEGAGCRIWHTAANAYRAGTNTRRQSYAASATRIQRPHCPRGQQRRGQRGSERRNANTPTLAASKQSTWNLMSSASLCPVASRASSTDTGPSATSSPNSFWRQTADTHARARLPQGHAWVAPALARATAQPQDREAVHAQSRGRGQRRR